MKWKVILEVEVTAAPGDFGGAASKGFKAIAKKFNNEELLKVKLLPMDGSAESELYTRAMDSCLGAETTPRLR